MVARRPWWTKSLELDGKELFLQNKWSVCVRGLTTLMIGLCVAGCAGRSGPRVPYAAYQPVPAAVAPAGGSPTVASPGVPADYRVNPLDQLRIDVFLEPGLSFANLPVDSSGQIVLPLTGPIHAEGMTTQELSHTIAQRLNRYLRNPQVAVNVTSFTSQRVTINGAVNRAGIYESAGKTTLMDAVAMAGGLNDSAKMNQILVFRRENGQRYVARFDLGAIQSGAAADPQIRPGDVVVVGTSEARRLYREALTVVPIAFGLFFALLN